MTYRAVILDDHEVVSAGLMSVLNESGKVSVVARFNNVDETNVFFEGTSDVDILITDIALQEVNTFNFVKNLKKSTPALKVVFISGFTDPQYHDRMSDAGADGFWCKLDPPSQLLDLVVQVLSSSDAGAPGVQSAKQFTSPLSNREEQIVSCLARGMTVKEIAEKYELSVKTVEAHKSNLMAKLSVHSQVELLRWAVKNGIVTP